MDEYRIGEQVRVDLPDETDPDFKWHGEHGYIIDKIHDDAGRETGDTRDSVLYRVGLEDHDIVIDLRWRDLRPPLD